MGSPYCTGVIVRRRDGTEYPDSEIHLYRGGLFTGRVPGKVYWCMVPVSLLPNGVWQEYEQLSASTPEPTPLFPAEKPDAPQKYTDEEVNLPGGA